jgi:hypothetical protein
MVKYGVLFEVRTGFLNKMQTCFVYKGLKGKRKEQKTEKGYENKK